MSQSKNILLILIAVGAIGLIVVIAADNANKQSALNNPTAQTTTVASPQDLTVDSNALPVNPAINIKPSTQAQTPTTSEPAKQQASIQGANLDLQAKCANQAQKALGTFTNTMGSAGYQGFAQQNHYNQKMDKCFVLISYICSNSHCPGTVGTDVRYQATDLEDLLDAYENTDLAHCGYYENRPSADLSNPDTYTFCSIGSSMASYAQYSDFVNQRMGLSQ